MRNLLGTRKIHSGSNRTKDSRGLPKYGKFKYWSLDNILEFKKQIFCACAFSL